MTKSALITGVSGQDGAYLSKFLIDKGYKVNPKFYRPADVEALLGDSSKANSRLGWKPRVKFDDLVSTMVKRDIERLEDQLSSLGGVFAEKRTSNKEKLTIVESELDGIKDQISQLLTETIPFALCPSISKSLLKRLDSEQDFEEKIAVSKVVDEFASKIKKEYKTDSKKLDKIVSKVSKEYAVDETKFKSRHDISKSDRDMMKNWIEDANNRAAKNLTTLCNQFESLSIESKSLSRSIGRAPPEKALSELVRDLGIKSEEVGKSEETIEALNYELQDVINQIADNDR